MSSTCGEFFCTSWLDATKAFFLLFALVSVGMLLLCEFAKWVFARIETWKAAVAIQSRVVLQNAIAVPDRQETRLDVNISNLDWLRLRLLFQPKTTTFVHGQRKKRVRLARTRRIRDGVLSSRPAQAEDEWIEYTDNGTFPKFLELPSELRDIIYEHAMDALPTRCDLLLGQPLSDLAVYPRTLPAFCFANKQLHHEGIHAWLRRTRLVVPHGREILEQLNAFLARHDGFKAVRMLSFLDLYEFEPLWRWLVQGEHSPAQLAAACSGLRKLSLEIKVATLFGFQLDPPASPLEIELKSSTDIVDKVGLAPLFALQSLRQVTIATTAPRSCDQLLAPHTEYSRDDFVRNLKNAVEEGFEKVGKAQKVKIDFVGLVWRDQLF